MILGVLELLILEKIILRFSTRNDLLSGSAVRKILGLAMDATIGIKLINLEK